MRDRRPPDAWEHFASAMLAPAAALPSGLVARAGADIGRRFAVYRNNVSVSLIDALRSRFPVTERIVGEEFFRAMAKAFVARHTPTSPLLFEYGAGFAGFAAGFEPARSVPYLADIAALEAARSDAWHAADAPTLGPPALSRLLAERPSEARLTARLRRHPAARIIHSCHPIASIWQAHEDTASPEFEGPWYAEAVLITRPDAALLVHALEPHEGAFAAALLHGAAIADAGAAALAVNSDMDVGVVLMKIAAAGAFTDLEQELRP